MPEELKILNRVRAALKSFFAEDYQLLHVDASERSISHKLAEHLQGQFFDYHVDCEYNRHRDDVKRLNFYDGEKAYPNDTEAKTVFPDIIIHEREHDERNLLVIEIKKSTNRDNERDLLKLKAFTDIDRPIDERFCYSMGLFLEFDCEEGNLSEVRVFRNGQEETAGH
jgi:hypothetical protein